MIGERLCPISSIAFDYGPQPFPDACYFQQTMHMNGLEDVDPWEIFFLRIHASLRLFDYFSRCRRKPGICYEGGKSTKNNTLTGKDILWRRSNGNWIQRLICKCVLSVAIIQGLIMHCSKLIFRVGGSIKHTPEFYMNSLPARWLYSRFVVTGCIGRTSSKTRLHSKSTELQFKPTGRV